MLPEQITLFGRAANCFSEQFAPKLFFDHKKKRDLFPKIGSSHSGQRVAAPRKQLDRLHLQLNRLFLLFEKELLYIQ